MMEIEIAAYLINRYLKYGGDAKHYTYEEWCAIYPLTKMTLNGILKYRNREL